MNLEEQLATLRELGIELAPGINIDDMLYSFPRESYEAKPFDLVLFILGAEVEREPWGRRFCTSVWNFDTECIDGGDAYVKIAKHLCRVACRPDAFSDVRGHVDVENGAAWIEYLLEGKHRRWDAEVNDDWADMLTVAYMMGDLECDGRKFRAKDNGQAMVLYYLNDADARRLSELAGEKLTTLTDPE